MSWAKNSSERGLEKLMDVGAAEPLGSEAPPELVERIVAEIPEQLPEMNLDESSRRDSENRQERWSQTTWARLAASLAVVVLGGFLASVLWRQSEPMPVATTGDEAARIAPEAGQAPPTRGSAGPRTGSAWADSGGPRGVAGGAARTALAEGQIRPASRGLA